ncbi:MAG: hypothetical protein P1P76_09365 [Anaerolineales bacterium]|nr:hypothetical protein [Anaerolineales bacterium]
MNDNAPFQPAESALVEANTYRPVSVPVRGELVAWAVATALVALCAVLIWQTGRLPVWVLLFTAIMLLLALAIRFSRWMEAHTVIEVGLDAIRYVNPLRKTELRWAELKQLTASRVGSGWMIVVVGDQGGFRFQTATTLKGTGGNQLRTGYPQGAEIVEQVLINGGFAEPHYGDSGWIWKAS